MATSRADADSLRLAAIVESSDDAIVSKDLNGIVKTWNRAAEQMFGYTAEEAIGRSIRLIIPNDRQNEEDEVIARIQRGERVDHYQTIRQRKDGTLIPVSLTVSPIRDHSGVVIGASKIARDMTAIRESERILANASRVQQDLQDRLRALVAASATVLASPRVADVLDSVRIVADRILTPDGLAIWRIDEKGAWRVHAHAGVSREFAEAVVTTVAQQPAASRPFTEPLIVSEVATEPLLADRLEAYTAESVTSLASIPLLIAGRPSGALTLYYRTRHDFSDVEVETARGLGNIAAAALTTAELYEEQQRRRERAAFLAQASTALAASLDVHATATTVVRQSVPAFADACVIHVFDDDGVPRVAAAAHTDKNREPALLTLASRPNPSPARGWGRALRDGEPQLLPEISADDVWQSLQGDPSLMAAFSFAQFTSQISVPMRTHGRLIGAVSFLLGPGKRRFTAADLELAEDLAGRCAIALENARLYEEAQRREAEALWSERRATFLAELGSTLASSLDYRETLRTVVRLAVPQLADWCAVDLNASNDRLERLASARGEGAFQPAEAIRQQDSPEFVAAIVRGVVGARQPLLVSDVANEVDAGDDRTRRDLVASLRALRISSIICVPLRAQGRAIGALTFVSTASGRRFVDEDVAFAQDVAQRMALAIENARAYEEARLASRLKDEFLATLSHELRTPLNAILGYSRMLSAGRLNPDKQERAFRIVERNASALSQIVGDILDVSRIISGKLRLEIAPIELADLVRDALLSVQPAADAKGVVLEAELPATPIDVRADGERLQQVVWNLLSNAVKFTPSGGRVRVGLEEQPSSVAIVVSDSGIGIPSEFLPHVFERFRQGDSRFAREHGGLGLGLAIARHLVEMHGGSIRASSGGPGAGSTFRVELPRTGVATTVTPPLAASGESRSEPIEGRELLEIEVLAVDDDGDALMLLRDALEEAGAVVITAQSAEEALRRMLESVPHVLVSDIGMPGVDGLELIRRVRASADPDVRAVPAAALTAYARSSDRSAAARAGYDVHLPKPIDPRVLVSAVARLVMGAGIEGKTR